MAEAAERSPKKRRVSFREVIYPYGYTSDADDNIDFDVSESESESDNEFIECENDSNADTTDNVTGSDSENGDQDMSIDETTPNSFSSRDETEWIENLPDLRSILNYVYKNRKPTVKTPHRRDGSVLPFYILMVSSSP